MLEMIFQRRRQSEEMIIADPTHSLIMDTARSFGGGTQSCQSGCAWKSRFQKPQAGYIKKIAVPPASLIGLAEIGDNQSHLSELIRNDQLSRQNFPAR
ncbi:hypothetical protein JT06_12325 [Desulfobulbus sp. Tol-SR]|nr:hypothetical protein JT06_12325 [Desulfobulbus sp. Tol-SR]